MRGAQKLLPLVARVCQSQNQALLAATLLARAGGAGIDALLLTNARVGWTGCHRSFATAPAVEACASVSHDEEREEREGVPGILHSLDVQDLRDEIAAAADQKACIPYEELLKLAKKSGAAQDDDQAERISKALHEAGVVLLHKDVAYLRPKEITDTIARALPLGKVKAKQRYEEIRAELEQLEKVHADLEQHASRRTNGMLWLGFFVLSLQFVGFYWATWIELSWDVMEPVAYQLSLFYALIGYLYFMNTQSIFDLAPIRQYWYRNSKEKFAQEKGFDERRYKQLQAVRERYKLYVGEEVPAPATGKGKA